MRLRDRYPLGTGSPARGGRPRKDRELRCVYQAPADDSNRRPFARRMWLGFSSSAVSRPDRSRRRGNYFVARAPAVKAGRPEPCERDTPWMSERLATRLLPPRGSRGACAWSGRRARSSSISKASVPSRRSFAWRSGRCMRAVEGRSRRHPLTGYARRKARTASCQAPPRPRSVNCVPRPCNSAPLLYSARSAAGFG